MRIRILPRALPTGIGLALLLLAAPLAADTVVLRDGRRVEGEVIRKTAEVVVVRTGLGELELPASEVVEIIEGKTTLQVWRERAAKAKTAADWFELGQWADEKKLRSKARSAWEKAVKLDGGHAGAHRALGHVLYKGRWMTPQQRDEQAAADLDAEMLAKGLVRHEGSWVTPEEKAKLEQGLVLYEGEWMQPDDAKRAQGLAKYGDLWMPAGIVLAHEERDAVNQLLGAHHDGYYNEDAFVMGPYEEEYLREVAGYLTASREWFDGQYRTEPGMALMGGRPAQFFLWDLDLAPYEDTVAHFVAQTPSLPEAAVPALRKVHGFYFFDPFTLSSARIGYRDRSHLTGHCVHHMGHLMVNRVGYDGTLLPPWYDEGLAALIEHAVLGKNHVFCRAEAVREPPSGTVAKGKDREFNTQSFRNGRWQEALADALRANRVPSFDKLAAKDLGDLELIDIATSIQILSWMIQTAEPGALRAFHDEVRKGQPPAPVRVLRDVRERHAVYDRAFGAAMGMPWKRVDREWRQWVLTPR